MILILGCYLPLLVGLLALFGALTGFLDPNLQIVAYLVTFTGFGVGFCVGMAVLMFRLAGSKPRSSGKVRVEPEF